PTIGRRSWLPWPPRWRRRGQGWGPRWRWTCRKHSRPPGAAAPGIEMTIAAGASPAPSRASLLLAFATLYVIWGSTYLAIRVAGVGRLVGGASHPAVGAPAAGSALVAGRVALLLASLSWSVGSLLSRQVPLPRQPAMASALEMLAAGPIIAAGAALKGEWGHF